jgi:hypothetical protein
MYKEWLVRISVKMILPPSNMIWVDNKVSIRKWCPVLHPIWMLMVWNQDGLLRHYHAHDEIMLPGNASYWRHCHFEYVLLHRMSILSAVLSERSSCNAGNCSKSNMYTWWLSYHCSLTFTASLLGLGLCIVVTDPLALISDSFRVRGD